MYQKIQHLFKLVKYQRMVAHYIGKLLQMMEAVQLLGNYLTNNL